MPSEHPPVLQAGTGAARPAPAPLPPRLTRGLHVVALFEAAKGLLVLAGGLGALSLLNRDATLIAEKLVHYLLLNPDWRIVHYLVERAGSITPAQLRLVAIISPLYAATRFTEAYGLWKNRAWAEWMAVFGGMIYLPFEINAVHRHASLFSISLLVINLLVVAYIARVLWIKRRAHAAAPAAA